MNLLFCKAKMTNTFYAHTHIYANTRMYINDYLSLEIYEDYKLDRSFCQHAVETRMENLIWEKGQLSIKTLKMIQDLIINVITYNYIHRYLCKDIKII